ncbi:uncharacterized protein LOC109611167 [Ooceraea biroi]|uniref:uncharacterized protein LOC109611167 n=1 Tax=Ooceraea biroi TaxID=2015173 RepID=UPI000F08F89F|nr:uncharacterized protein LOC109611167 [Ooceraea biroi]
MVKKFLFSGLDFIKDEGNLMRCRNSSDTRERNYKGNYFLNMDNKDNVKILLMLYQQHPCLYVTKCAEYYNRMKRDKALQIICKQYTDLTGQPLTVDIAKKKINNLRSQYLEQLNKIKQSKSSGASTDDIYTPTWWLFEDMSFLNPRITQRKGESSIMISNSQSELLEHETPKNEIEDLQFRDVCNILNTDYDSENTNPNVQSPSCSINSSTSSNIASLIKKKKKICRFERNLYRQK